MRALNGNFLLFAAIFNNKKLMDDLVKNWDQQLPITFYYDHLYADQQKQITEQLNEFYFQNEPFLDSNRDNLTKARKILRTFSAAK